MPQAVSRLPPRPARRPRPTTNTHTAAVMHSNDEHPRLRYPRALQFGEHRVALRGRRETLGEGLVMPHTT